MYKLVLMRHGESVWNKENKFTGWTEVELRAIAKEQGLITLRNAAITKLLEGRTTIDEVFSVTVAEK